MPGQAGDVVAGRGRVVAVDRLIDVVWGTAPPKAAITRVHGLVSQLRRSLGAPRGTPAQLITRPPGYLLEVARGKGGAHRGSFWFCGPGPFLGWTVVRITVHGWVCAKLERT
jgi:hypothetical protein